MKKIWKARACRLAVCLALGFGTSAKAAEHSGTKDEQEACTPDVFRLCLFDIPSETRIVACLNRNVKDLSPECRNVIAGPEPKNKGRTNR